MAGGPESAQPSALTMFLAAWGAAVATVTAAWTLYRGLTDRGHLRVHCYIGVVAAPGVGIVNEDLLVYSVTNVGRRNVIVASVGGEHKTGEYRGFMLTQTNVQFPRTLAPGEYFTAYTDDLSMFSGDVKFLSAEDSLGRTYKASRKDLERTADAARAILRGRSA